MLQRSLFSTLFYRDCLVSYRKRGDYLLALSFWLVITCFFPLSSNADPKFLQTAAPGIIWFGFLLTQILHLPKFFSEDDQDGILAELTISPNDFLVIVLYKLINFCVLYYLPALLIAPLLGLMLQLPSKTILVVEWTILLGSPSLTALSGFVASLTTGLKNNALLITLLFLPLTLPTLIFATSAINSSMLNTSTIAALTWLAVLLCISLALFPVSIYFILKSNHD